MQSSTNYTDPSYTLEKKTLEVLMSSDFRHNTDCCHLQNFSDDTTIPKLCNRRKQARVWEGYHRLCRLVHSQPPSHQHQQDEGGDFRRNIPQTTLVNMQGLDMEMMSIQIPGCSPLQ